MGVNLMQVCVHMCVLRNIRFISTGVYCNTAAFLTSPHIVSTFGVQLQQTFKTNEIAGVLHLLIHLTNLVTYSWSYLSWHSNERTQHYLCSLTTVSMARLKLTTIGTNNDEDDEDDSQFEQHSKHP